MKQNKLFNILRNFIEQVNKWQATLYLNFIDFEMVFNSIPENVIRMVKIFCEDFKCAIDNQGEIGEWFDIKTGVKQGCNMSGFLFLIGHGETWY